MNFWKSEKCEFCGGRIIEKTEDIPKKSGTSYVVFKDVPIGVCSECGTRYFSANVLKTLEEKIKHKKEAKKILKVPLLKY